MEYGILNNFEVMGVVVIRTHPFFLATRFYTPQQSPKFIEDIANGHCDGTPIIASALYENPRPLPEAIVLGKDLTDAVFIIENLRRCRT